MYNVIMVIDDNEYIYGTYKDGNKANEIAMQVRDEREVAVFVDEI